MLTTRAAGGVAWRPTGDTVEVCLVHRPRHDDWSLPKGKLEPGEHPLLAAVREVAEEADVQAVPQVRLLTSRYVSDGRPKTVDYWAMRLVGSGGFQPETEVDEVRWLPISEAIALATYPQDAVVLRAFAALPPVTGTLVLARHADAGDRATWSGPDIARPLTALGWEQAHRLANLLTLIRPVRLLAASVERCAQTLQPVATALRLPIEVDDALDEPLPGQPSEAKTLVSAQRLTELAVAATPAILCGQGKTIPGTLRRLSAQADVAIARIPHSASADGDNWATPKGGGWLLAFATDRLIAADRL